MDEFLTGKERHNRILFKNVPRGFILSPEALADIPTLSDSRKASLRIPQLLQRRCQFKLTMADKQKSPEASEKESKS